MLRATLLALCLATGCGRFLGIEELSGPPDGGGPPGEAGPDTPAGDTIQIVGTATTNLGTVPIENLTVQFVSEGVVVGGAPTGADGGFIFDVPLTSGMIDGYLLATGLAFLDTYVYPARPLATTTTLNVPLYTASDIKSIATSAQVSGDPAGTTTIIATMLDSGGSAVQSATVQIDQAQAEIRYNDIGTPFPGSTSTSTMADGMAWLFLVDPASATVTGQVLVGSYPPRTITFASPSVVVLPMVPMDP